MDSSEQALLLAFRGNVLVELERPVDAEASYREALKANSSNRTARRNLGRLLFNAKKYPAALETWLPELADGRRDAELLSMVGRARYEVAKADQNPAELQSARVALEQVLIEKPDDVDTIKILADIAFEAGRHAEARTYYDLVRRRTPLDGDALEKLGYCALSLGDKRQALDYLELAAGSKLASKELCSTLSTLCPRAQPPLARRRLARAELQERAGVRSAGSQGPGSVAPGGCLARRGGAAVARRRPIRPELRGGAGPPRENSRRSR
jgi:predicted Zn-dependent protease